ncbi:glycine zipper domain-containing protein [Ancylobacter sp. VNQ12]|uniref:glycine zipper domain-containing protein n=1 Tax=Ancylobacter sp. VNQ12 TaxID=3400920 RepID=UPI003BFC3957
MLRRLACAAILAGAAALWAVGPVSAQNSTARGAVIGGATGAVVGGAVTGTGRGALVGGAIGAGTGAAIGANRNRRVRSYYFWRHGNCYLRQNNGRVVRVARNRCRR